MSRLDVTRHLYEKDSFVITDGDKQTKAGPENNQSQYQFVYCATPQKLFLMRFRLDDSFEAFIKTKKKFEKRYGQPAPLDTGSDYRDSANWENVEVAFLWHLNDSENILLIHAGNGTSAEFQDLSVCD